MPKARISLFFPVSALLCLLAAFSVNSLFTYSVEDLAERASAGTEARLALSQHVLRGWKEKAEDFSDNALYDRFADDRMGLYLWQGDSLLFWNNAQIPLNVGPQFFKHTQGLAELRQGYYLYVRETDSSGRTHLALSRIRSAYDLQNNYLKNNFLRWTGIPKDAGISFSLKSGVPVLLQGQTLFYISGGEDYLAPWAANLATAFFVFAWLLGLLSLLLLIRRGVSSPTFTALLLSVLLLRALLILFDWPAFLYHGLLYDVQVYGDAGSSVSFFLGDILLNALTLLFMSTAAWFHFPLRGTGLYRLLTGLLLFFASAFSVYQFNYSIGSLVNNSTLDFDFLNIFNIRAGTVFGLIALAAWAMALYVATVKFFAIVATAGKTQALTWPLLFTLGVCLLQILKWGSGFETWWFLLFGLSVWFLSRRGYAGQPAGIGFQVLLMSFVASVLFISHIGKKTQLDLSVLSSGLSERRDPILENEFSGLPARISADESLGNLLRILPDTRREIEQLLKQRYFGEYFNRYHIELSLFDSLCTPLLRPQQPILLNEGFFEDQIRWNADSTGIGGLWFVNNFRSGSRYIGRVPLRDKRLYVFMEPKQFEEQGSFPDLLLDQSQQKQEFRNFSYAVYRADRTTARYGDLNYPFFLPDSASLALASPDYEHRYFSDGDATQIISQRRRSGTDHFTYNSYLFLFFSLICYGAYYIYAAIFTNQFSNPSLTRRIQSIIIVLLLLVMSAVGVTSGILVSRQFRAENLQQLREKTNIVINELVAENRPEEIFDINQREIIGGRLNEFSHLFDAVITLFDRNGRLFNTSQPRLYELGLAAPLANPRALETLRNNSASSESVSEMAGSLQYLSLYTPLYNAKRELVGFVNLPYFARQKDLVDELSGIISALINVYIILFVISILAGLLLSGYITQPLQLIKQQIANISLGRQNEKIQWESNDEIGRLVFEYNQMLVKLEESANLLARSEREGAWREMAKQVAHEIKNPLTPMKLNLQYLQHLMKNNPADFREKFEKASAGIIEQIDTLAGIANEFSNFARLPAAQLSSLDLREVIAASASVVEPYKHIHFDNQIVNPLFVKGDREQCLRVFNNLLTNAVQALDGQADARIRIRAEETDTTVRVLVEDNGPGIPEELKAKIFSPNFTTKSTGSGLGLAMVRNILQGFGGAVGFESQAGNGARFWVEFVRS